MNYQKYKLFLMIAYKKLLTKLDINKVIIL